MNEFNKTETLTDIRNKLVVTSEERGGGEGKKKVEIKRYRLL